MSVLCKSKLSELCKKNGGYAQPSLNNQLFLHCQGVFKIENLEEYTELKALWLQQNAIEKIEGLDSLKKLTALILHSNFITKIEGLEALSNLRVLDLSSNRISKLSNIATCCPLLESLQIAHNRLHSLYHDCSELLQCKNLSLLDLSSNSISRVEDENLESIIAFFSAMPSLSVLYIQGNEFYKGLRAFRKEMVLNVKTLTYLNDAPIDENERLITTAWKAGGVEAENEQRIKIKKEKQERLQRCVSNLVNLSKEHKEIRERRTREWEEKQEIKKQERIEKKRSFCEACNIVSAEEEKVRTLSETAAEEAFHKLFIEELIERDNFNAINEILISERKCRKSIELAQSEEIKEMSAEFLKELETLNIAEMDRIQHEREEADYWLAQMSLSDEDVVRGMEHSILKIFSKVFKNQNEQGLAGENSNKDELFVE